MVLARWRRAASQIATAALQRELGAHPGRASFFGRRYAAVASGATRTGASDAPSPPHRPFTESEVSLNALFWSMPCSLTLPLNSPLRVEEPHYDGFRRIMLKLLLFYSKQSEHIRGANVVYRRIISQVDKSAIYDVFHLEKAFKTTFSLLVLHMWLCLRRLKKEGKEGTKFGQYLYDIYNHDLELRVSKAGVSLLLTKWMKDLEKIFYGNIAAYDTAMSPDAKVDDLANVIWRNVFSEDVSKVSNDAVATAAVQAMARYTRRESTCLLLTDKEAIFSGNFMFTSLESKFNSEKMTNKS